MEDNEFQSISPASLGDNDSSFGGGGFVVPEDGLESFLNNGGSPVADASTVTNIEETEFQQAAPKTKVQTKSKTPSETTIVDQIDEDEKEGLDRILAADAPEDGAGEITDTTEVAEPEDEEISVFQNLAESLFELNIFNKQEGEEPGAIKTPEDFKARWEQEKVNQVNQQLETFLLSKHGQEGLEVFQAIFMNGVSPQEYLSKYNEIGSLQEMDLDDPHNQELIYRTYHRKQGWSDEKINKYLEKDKTYGDLQEKATDFHELLVKDEQEDLEEITKQAQLREQQRVQYENFYTQKMNQLISDKLKNKEFDGIPVTDKIARETFSYLTEKRFSLPTGEQLTTFDKDILELRKPENFELKLKMALLLRNGFDLSKVKTKAVAESKDKIFNKLIQQNKINSRNNSNKPTTKFVEG